MVAIDLRNFGLRYPGQENRALNDISLNVDTGEFIGIVGRTGAGKTTLLSCMCGIIPFQIPAKREGNIYINGKSLEEYGSIHNMSSEISMVLDTPDNQLFNLKVHDEIIWGLENMGIESEEIIERAEKAMNLFELDGYEDRITYNLSGGEKQKVAIASIYAMNPSIILLDEPTSQLDPIGTKLVFEAIDQLAQENITIIMVEHKVDELVQYADRLIHLKEGEIHRIGEPKSFFDQSSLSRGEIAPPQIMELGMQLKKINNNLPIPATVQEGTEEYLPILENFNV